MDINEEINALIAEMDEISHRKSSTKVEKCNNYVRYNDVRNLILIKVLEVYLAGYRLIAPTLTPPNASRDLISRSALLRGETEPEIITGSDSELAEHMEWDRWMDKIKRAPAVDKEEES